MRELIQNAVYVIPHNQFYVSTHTHDFVSFEIDGVLHYIDGGNEYCRCTVMPECVQNYNLFQNASDQELQDKLLWGTRGPTGTDPLKWVLLKDCETDHLQKILTIPNLDSARYKTIQNILKGRVT